MTMGNIYIGCYMFGRKKVSRKKKKKKKLVTTLLDAFKVEKGFIDR